MKDTTNPIIVPPISSVANTPWVAAPLTAEARRLKHRQQRRHWKQQLKAQLPRLSLLGMGRKWV